MSRAAFLEDFDDLDTAATVAPGPGPDWHAGYAAGFAEARASIEAEQARHLGALCQTLSDMAFGYAEARHDILTRLEPLFQQLFDRLLPALVPATLASHLAARLIEAAGEDAALPLRITVHPDLIGDLETALTSIAGLPADLFPDPDMTRGQAVVTAPAGETALDLDRFLAEAQALLRALFESDTSQLTERTSHG